MIEMLARANGVHKEWTTADESDRTTIERWGYEVASDRSAVGTDEIGCCDLWFLRVTLESKERASVRCCELVERFGTGIRLLQLANDRHDASRRCLSLLVENDVLLEVVDRLSGMMVRRILHVPVLRTKSKTFVAPTCFSTSPATETAARLVGVVENTSTRLRRIRGRLRARVAV